ncbi:MAG: acryloyl-CoA reductase [Ornithinimicrobium sp.]|uniref:acrylyl-CoA reductase family protein n=1 Tax=Ornithinimicrobium sp. TaxID=1977084 RepID=UPI003D9B5EB5
MGEAHRLGRMLAPASVALVGASTVPNVAGNDMVLELQVSRYPGRIYPVNPKYAEVEGHPCYPSLRELPHVPDLAVLGVGNDRLEEQVATAIELGMGGLVIPGSALLPTDSEESSLRSRIRSMALAADLPIVGGNCMGFYNVERWFRAFPFNRPYELQEGGVTLLAQSGSVLTALLWNDQKLRYNLAISPGQELVTSLADYMDYALAQDSTRVIALFVESVRKPEAFLRALEKAADRDVPVVALKAGRTVQSAKLALSHSGAIAGDDAAYRTMFERYGVLSVKSLDELAATALLLSDRRRPGPGGLAAIHDSGGERELLIDLAADVGVPFAQISETTTTVLAEHLDHGLEAINPLDAWGTGNDYQTIFERCWQALMDDDDTALGVFVIDLTSGFYLHESFARICRRVHRRTTKPVAMLTNHIGTDSQDLARRLTDLGIPVLDGTVAGLIAVRNALEHRDFTRRPIIDPPTKPDPSVTTRWRARLSRPEVLTESEGLELLADYGVPTVPHRVVSDGEAALAAAAEVGYPVAVKTAALGVTHKSDVGGVVLNVSNQSELRAAYSDLAERRGPEVLVAPMIVPRVEMALGIVSDPQFGPMVLIAGGGVFIEVLGDRQLGLVPIDAPIAERMIDKLAIAAVLDAVRGGPPADKASVVPALVALSDLAADVGDLIAELDVNPLAVTLDGCMALDALVIPTAAVATAAAAVGLDSAGSVDPAAPALVRHENPDPDPQESSMSDTFTALVVREAEEGNPKSASASIEQLTDADLPRYADAEEVVVDIDYSSLNYKDGMALTGKGRIIRSFPMVPGIDFAGTVVSSESERFGAGDGVVLTGWGVGERYWGGYTQRQRVRADWLVSRPDGLSSTQAMGIGTAGLTAMLCVLGLEDGGVSPEDGPVVVTGAAGGVGSVAVAILANLGYQVAAVTGRPEQHDYLRSLGATEFLSREEMTGEGKPLETETWAGAVDTVGSTMLARVLAQARYGGVVTACGLAGGVDLPSSVMPFILRGVRLQGVDSVQAPLEVRETAWARLARDLPGELLESLTEVVAMSSLLERGPAILAGQVRGRVVVDPHS